jgi:hypothetical protein
MPTAKEPIAKPARRRGWRVFFTTFKWCRISVLLFVLVVIVLGLFLNHVGLPDWLEQRVEEQFRASGWEVKFSRLRLRWYHGIVAEDLQLQRTNTLNGPHLFLQRAEFRLNSKALQHLDLEADSVLLRGGRLVWPLPGTNVSQRTFVLEDVAGELLFKQGDLWELRYLEANTLGTHLRFRGDITNASFIREWKLPSRPPRDRRVSPAEFWQRFLVAASQFKLAGKPALSAMFAGDARDWKTFEATVKFTGHGVSSPWGGGTNVFLVAHLLPPPRSNEAVRADFKLTADRTYSPWGSAESFDATLVAEPSFTQLFPSNSLVLLELNGVKGASHSAGRLFVEFRSAPSYTNGALNESRLDVTAESVAGRYGQIERLRLTSTTVHATTNLLPVTLETAWSLGNIRTSWATSQWARAAVKFDLPDLGQLRSGVTNATWPERLREVPCLASIAFSNIIAPSLELERAGVSARWRFPELALDADVERRDASASINATLQTTTRDLRFGTSTKFDPGMLAPFLNTNARPLLKLASFNTPPRLRVEGRMTVPESTNSAVEWHREILPTVSMAGRIDAGACAIREVQCASLDIPFTLTNLIWSVPTATLARPEGALDITGSSDLRTGDFEALVRNGCDLLCLRPVFPEKKVQTIFGWFQLPRPVKISARLQGNWNDFSRFQADADVAVTNATFRGHSVQSATARVLYTNRFLSISRPLVLRDGEHGMADGIGIDLARPRLYLTNATGNIAPRVITKSIDDDADRILSAFVFDVPPTSRANGSVPLGKTDHTEDMRFDVEGGPFHWKRFHLEHVKGTIFWERNIVTITNIHGDWHGADLAGWVRFEVTRKGAPDLFSFQFRVGDADLRTVLRDFQPDKTNKVEGKFSGELSITSGDTVNWDTWQGYGHAQLTNGLLWEIPLFGVFSPVLNAFFPGLGNSRARQAATTFEITNSVIYSKDLEIRATAMRMKYQGAVDFEGRVEGRMEAELLRDMPAFGYLISKVFWPVTKLFEYKITGTLDNPKTEQLYAISKLFILPFAPFKTIKDILNQDFSEPPPLGSKPPASLTPTPVPPLPPPPREEKPPEPKALMP